MSGLARLGITGERSRRAQDNLGRASADLVLALRRVLPFLTRKRVAVVAAPPRTALFAELAEAVPNLTFTMPFVAGPNRAPGVLAIDATGIARILDGVLGGGDGDPSAPAPTTLSSAQIALAGRVSEGILRAFAEAVRSRLGLVIEASGGTAVTDAGAGAVLSLALAGGGVVALAIPLSALGEGLGAVESSDGRMAAVVVEIELEVVVELGKVRLPLSALASLAVGDIVQLSLPLDEQARVCAGGAVLFRGRPTATGVTIGIAIERHAT
ncbi:MAG TPA: FliM/FliN family flagellar motor switch protein [Labilithrix sp.]|nr:FliM/FliN family flagellar motor switch protein [Labilithrix sp.]